MNPIEALQHLEQAGVPAAQARAIANVIEQRRDQLVTSAELKTEMGALSAELKTEVGALRLEMSTLEIRLSDKIAHVKDELEGQIRGLWRLVWPALWQTGADYRNLAGEKVVESWNLWDTLGMLQQLGVVAHVPKTQ